MTSASCQITANYRDAAITVALTNAPSAKLFINGMLRQEMQAESLPHTFRLSSPVQTDYEWHEQIDVVAQLSAKAAKVEITSGTTHVHTQEQPWN